jgi:hypothetical protein
MDSYRMAVAAHLVAGSIALILFWTAGLMKKGTPLHRKVGRFYLGAMLAVVLTGVPMVSAIFARGQLYNGLFLSFLLLLVSTSCWSSWRAIRDRRDARRYFGPVYWLLVGLTGVAGASISLIGLNIGASLLAIFGLVGVGVGISGVRAWTRADQDPKWWLKEHYGAMIGNGVATHIAFLGIGLRKAVPALDPGTLQLLAFTAPIGVAIAAGWWLNRKYGEATAPSLGSADRGRLEPVGR